MTQNDEKVCNVCGGDGVVWEVEYYDDGTPSRTWAATQCWECLAKPNQQDPLALSLALEKCREALEEYLVWFEELEAHQEPLLTKSLEEAEKNWDVATSFRSFDTNLFRETLKETAQAQADVQALWEVLKWAVEYIDAKKRGDTHWEQVALGKLGVSVLSNLTPEQRRWVEEMGK